MSAATVLGKALEKFDRWNAGETQESVGLMTTQILAEGARKYLALLLSNDTLVLEKVDGRWPVEAIGAMAGTYYGLIEQGGLLADVFVAQLDALSDQ